MLRSFGQSKGVARIWFRVRGHPFRGARPPIFRLRPQITRVPLVYFWLPPDFGGPPPPPPGYALRSVDACPLAKSFERANIGSDEFETSWTCVLAFLLCESGVRFGTVWPDITCAVCLMTLQRSKSWFEDTEIYFRSSQTKTSISA